MKRFISMVLVLMMILTLMPINNSYGLDGAINNGEIHIKSVYGGVTQVENTMVIWGGQTR